MWRSGFFNVAHAACARCTQLHDIWQLDNDTRQLKYADERVRREHIAFRKFLEKMPDMPSVSVFPSYSWPNPKFEKEHIDEQTKNARMVEKVAQDLALANVEVNLDKHKDKLTRPVHEHTISVLNDSDFIVVLGTPTYLWKIETKPLRDGREPMVCAEFRQIMGRLGRSTIDANSVIAMVLSGTRQTSLPKELDTNVRINLADNRVDYYSEIIRLICGVHNIDSRCEELQQSFEHFLREENTASSTNDARALVPVSNPPKQDNPWRVHLGSRSDRAKRAATAVRVGLPAREKYFIERSDVSLAHLGEALDQIDGPLAITGMSGSGKTSLMAAFAHAQLDPEGTSPYEVVRWMDAEKLGLATWAPFAEDLGMNAKDVPLSELVKGVYERLQGRRCLILFDNIANRKSLEGHLPPREAADDIDVMVTTLSNQSLWDRPKVLREFTPEETKMFADKLRDMQGQARFNEDDLRELHRVLGGLVSAVVYALAYIHETPTMTVKDFCNRFAQVGIELLEEESVQLPGQEIRRTLDKVFLIVLEDLEVKCPEAMRLLTFMSLMSDKGIPIKVMKKFYGDDRSIDALTAIGNRSLITDITEDSFSMHLLLQAFVCKTKLPGVWRIKQGEVTLGERSVHGLLDDWLLPLKDALTEDFPRNPGTREEYDQVRQLLPHIESLLGIVSKISRAGLSQEMRARLDQFNGDLEYWVGRSWRDSFNYDAAAKHLRNALDLLTEVYNPDHKEIASTQHTLGRVYRYQRDFKNADQAFDEALRIKRLSRGECGAGATLAVTLGEKSRVQLELGHIEEARRLCDQGLEALGSEMGDIGVDVGEICEINRKIELATPQDINSFLSKIERDGEVFGEEHVDVAAILRFRGRIYEKEGNLAEALRTYHNALKVSNEQYGRKHLRNGVVHQAIGQVLRKLGRWNEAVSSYQNALAIKEQVYAGVKGKHLDVVSALAGLVLAHRGAGEQEEEEGCVQAISEILQACKPNLSVLDDLREESVLPAHELDTYYPEEEGTSVGIRP